MAAPDTALRPSGKRPKDRKAQIAAAAAAQFRELGYPRVGVEDIAAAVGITGRAIYRHFDTKQALLSHLVFEGLARFEAASASSGDLADVVDALTAVALDQRHLGVLLVRETRHLAVSEQAEVVRRTDAVVDQLTALLQTHRPEVHADEAEFLTRCTLSLLASPSHHHVSVAGAERLLAAMAVATLDAPLQPGVESTPPPAGVERASRRETVIAAAVERFGRRGYDAVRMEDVGAAAGIAGPSIYEHFDSKADLLMSVLTRGAEWLQLGLATSIVPGAPAAESLERVVRSYLSFAVEHRDLMRVFLREANNLPDAERSTLRRVQHDYVAEWVRLLRVARPELTEEEAWFVTHGGISIVNETVEATRRFDLIEVAMAVLLPGRIR